MALFVLRCGERDRFYRSVTGLVRVSRLTDHTVWGLVWEKMMSHRDVIRSGHRPCYVRPRFRIPKRRVDAQARAGRCRPIQYQ